ncbi:MFS general substrate transporter [Schizopora paradoxa]|uniref:MFS general substrate transporter n=1 Tax=Schizopora paradoxa TaxID=27342 RepID=A0A0H2RVP9_9AGAM|nr:MFS general substrate transporter [Schizopora paradoxa]
MSNDAQPSPLLRVPSRSRPRSSRNTSTSSVLYLPQGPDALLYPEGAVSEEAVELLHDFVHPSHQRPDGEQTLVGEDEEDGDGSEADSDEEEERGALASRPWYKRPSPWWILSTMPFSAMAMSACVAPRVEIYTELACRAHRPEYETGRILPPMFFRAIEPQVIANYTEDDISYIVPSLNYGDNFAPEEPNPCAKDPEVNAAAAKLIAAMTTVMGILSCLTTGFWGSFSDRVGRLRIMGISVIGLLVTDFNFIFVYNFSERLPGGYWFLLLGPFVEGLLGGFTAGVAAIHAYVADTTDPTSRSRTFSLSLGLLFIGMAFGPTLGSVLIRSTHQVITVFYFATATHIAYSLLVWFVIPESLSPRVMAANKEKRRRENEEAQTNASSDSRTLVVLKRAFAFLSPLTVFAPETIRLAGSTKTRRDWNLTLLAAAFGFSGLVFSSYQYKFQYAAMTFGWTSEELGYWLSLVGATRAFYLTAILPVIIKLFNRPKPAIQLPTSPSEPLNNDPSSALPPDSSEREHPHHAPSQHRVAPHTPSFDLGLARASLALEVVCYAAIPLAMYPLTFTALSMLVSFGGGFNPAVQALALELFTRRLNGGEGGGAAGEGANGRLFGALSVVQAMCSQIIGPALFGITYMKTVAVLPKTIFFVSAGCITLSFVCLSFVRIDKLSRPKDQEATLSVSVPRAHGVDREETLVGGDSSALEERDTGTKKTVKTANLIEIA